MRKKSVARYVARRDHLHRRRRFLYGDHLAFYLETLSRCSEMTKPILVLHNWNVFGHTFVLILRCGMKSHNIRPFTACDFFFKIIKGYYF